MHKQHKMLEQPQKYNNLQNSFPLKERKVISRALSYLTLTSTVLEKQLHLSLEKYYEFPVISDIKKHLKSDKTL